MTSKDGLAKRVRKNTPDKSRVDRRHKSEAQPVSRLLRPDPGPEAYSSFFPDNSRQWEVVLSGELEDKEGGLHEKLVELPRGSRGLIYFDSCGGSAFIGLALASLIRLRGLKATGVVVGECSSAALMPLAACAERYVTTHSTLLFHPIRWQSEEQVKLEEAAEWARHFRVMELNHEQLLARLFGCNVEVVRSWSHPGRFVSGEELAAAGLARMLDLFAGDVWQQIAGQRATSWTFNPLAIGSAKSPEVRNTFVSSPEAISFDHS